MSVIKGTGSQETFQGVSEADIIFGEGGNDVVKGGGGDDRIHGGGGDDLLVGNAGNDVIFGAATSGGQVDMDKFRIFEDTTAKITFLGESAGYKNALGMYKIGADGTIYDVEMVFANASLKGSGGNLISGESSVSVDLKAGDRVGFFVVPNAYSQSGMAKLLSYESASFKFVDATGAAGNVNGGSELKLVQVDAKGMETVVKSQYGTSVFHSYGGAEAGLNGDNYDHVNGVVDVATGSVTIGFEDLWKGGDKDFDDSVFSIDIGQTNAALLAKEGSGAPVSSDDDVIVGGRGDDQLFGMRGDDLVKGGSGDDRIWGNSGEDDLRGGAGDDAIYGGSDNDILRGGGGNDYLEGNSGDDDLRGGAGDDEIWGNSGNDVIRDGAGNDKIDGGSGDDVFKAGDGDDFYNGASGFDTLDYSASKGGINADLSKHVVTGFGNDEVWGVERFVGSRYDDVIKGDKRDNVIAGGNGDDVIRGLGGADTLSGGEGDDKFVWFAKDVVDQKTGDHLGVDHITDFQVGDMIDIHELVKGQKFDDISDVVRVADGKNGATVSVKLGEGFVDVVTVDGIAADDLLSHGLILS